MKGRRFTSLEFNSTGFSAADFQGPMASRGPLEKTTVEDRSANKFANKLIRLLRSGLLVSTGLLVSSDLVVAGGEAVYDAEYQLKCYTGYGHRDVTSSPDMVSVLFSLQTGLFLRGAREIARFQVAQVFTFTFSAPVRVCRTRILSSFIYDEWPPVEEPAPIVIACTACTNCSAHEAPVLEPEPEVTHTDADASAPVEPAVEDPQLEEPARAAAPAAEPILQPIYLTIAIDDTTDTPDTEDVDPSEETPSTETQIKTVSLDIQVSLIDDVGPILSIDDGSLVSVAAGSLVSHVVGAETISSGSESAKLSGKIIAAQDEQITGPLAPQVEQIALSFFEHHHLAEAARCISTSSTIRRRGLAVRQYPLSAETLEFDSSLFEATLPQGVCKGIFSSLPLEGRQDVSPLEQMVLAVSSVEPNRLAKNHRCAPSAGAIEASRNVIQKIGPVLVFMTAKAPSPVPAKAPSSLFARKGFASSKKGAVETF
ncbi:hypothetical protein CEK25_002891 [Fusarium fujikuroi]|nr:hypothetical protein CEK25_002891 [Fusarium fujikuroi]